LCAQQAAQRMWAGGVIVNITEAGVGKAWRGMGVYLLSKSALESLTRLLARRLAPEIRVNAVAPGLILPGEGTSAEEWQRLIARLPLQQQGDPQSVVDAVLFLLDNEHITGQTIVVDGGYQLL
jgi:pteridine reductase